MSQRQDSLRAQLETVSKSCPAILPLLSGVDNTNKAAKLPELVRAYQKAVKLGCYDAADFIIRLTEIT
jgi:hypothetical protein